MMRYSHHLAWTLVVCALGAVGCSSGGLDQETLFDVQVLVDGHPAADVRVAMQAKGGTETPLLLVGVTDSHGIAGMMMVEGGTPAADVTQYSVSVESLGDWQLAKQWSDPSKTPLFVSWPSSEDIVVEIPKKAIRRL